MYEEKEKMNNVGDMNMLPGEVFKVQMSTEDLTKLSKVCEKHGMTVRRAIENLIVYLRDDGNQEWCKDMWSAIENRRPSIESKESVYVQLKTRDSLYKHLEKNGYEPEEYLDVLKEINALQTRLATYQITGEDAVLYENRINECSETLEQMRKGWQLNEKSDMDAEVRELVEMSVVFDL